MADRKEKEGEEEKLNKIITTLEHLKLNMEILRQGNEQTREQITQINSKLGLIENKVEECQEKDINRKLLDKVADLEDRSRRANLRLRAAGESLQIKENLKGVIAEWLATNAQVPSQGIERIHWAFRGGRKPKDILIRFTREAERDIVYRKLRKMKNLTLAGSKVWPLLDLSSETLGKRAEMREITGTLERKGQHYILGKNTNQSVILEAKTLPIHLSDHAPLRVKVKLEIERKERTWRYNTVLNS
uniref:L1 transposable element RRM domain-containing protein n=1 Tax=Anolis carolinensis TaxID=28377 RepID=A0A803TWH1_ANOCA